MIKNNIGTQAASHTRFYIYIYFGFFAIRRKASFLSILPSVVLFMGTEYERIDAISDLNRIRVVSVFPLFPPSTNSCTRRRYEEGGEPETDVGSAKDSPLPSLLFLSFFFLFSFSRDLIMIAVCGPNLTRYGVVWALCSDSFRLPNAKSWPTEGDLVPIPSEPFMAREMGKFFPCRAFPSFSSLPLFLSPRLALGRFCLPLPKGRREGGGAAQQ